MTDLGLLVLRLVLGLGLAVHGYDKIAHGMAAFIELLRSEHVPFPAVLAWAVALIELAGGLCVALGLCARIAALLPAFTLLVGVLLVHMGQPFLGGWELPILYLGGLVAIAALGPGKFSVDGFRGKNVSV